MIFQWARSICYITIQGIQVTCANRINKASSRAVASQYMEMYVLYYNGMDMHPVLHCRVKRSSNSSTSSSSSCPSVSSSSSWHVSFRIVFQAPKSLMLVSHCGEYMANGLTNAVRHEFVMIANDRQTFVAVRKHSRSFLWFFECYAGLASGECMAIGLTNAIRHQFAMIAK